MQQRILAGAFAALGQAVTGLFATDVTILRVSRTPDDYGSVDETPAAAGSFRGRLEPVRERNGEMLIASQMQGRVRYTLYYPLTIGSQYDPAHPDALYLTHTDRVQIGGRIYEVDLLTDPQSDAVCRQALLWRTTD